LQNPNQINRDNLQNVKRETSRIFRNKKREYSKCKINELETNNKNKNIRDLYRGINEFKKGYQPRINIIKDENGNPLADPQNVFNRWKNFFNQVLSVHGVHDVRQMEIHTAEPLVPEPNLVKVEIAIGKLKICKSPGTDQIPAELIKAGGETLYSSIYRLICCIWNKEELPQQWKESIIVPIYKKGVRLIVIIIEESPSYQLPTKFYLTFFWLGKLHMSMKLLGIMNVGSIVTDLLPIRFSTFARY
jgi:hypothetical protein